MSQIEFQKTLFGIYSRKSLRSAFLASPEEFIKKSGLRGREARALLALKSERIEEFAHSLSDKKIRVLRQILGTSPGIIIATSAYLDGPILFAISQKKQKESNITPGGFELIKNLPSAILDIYGLFKSYLASEKANSVDFIKISYLISTYGFWGRKIRILS